MREVVALHRNRYVFPIKLLVTKTGGSGQDAMFMGMLKVSGCGGAVGCVCACMYGSALAPCLCACVCVCVAGGEGWHTMSGAASSPHG